MSETDPKAALTAHAAARGDSLAALSAMLGRNAAYLQQYVRRGTPRRLAERDRRLLADYFGIAETVLGGPEAAPAGFCIPRLAVAAWAGPGALVDDEIVLGTDRLDPALARRLRLREGQAAIIRVRGDSMAPGLLDGDHIVVDTADRRPTTRGGVFVLRIDAATMVKRVTAGANGLTIASDNPAAPPLPEGETTIIGRVVWQMREPR